MPNEESPLVDTMPSYKRLTACVDTLSEILANAPTLAETGRTALLQARQVVRWYAERSVPEKR